MWISTDRLSAPGITPDDIIAALQARNIDAAVGRSAAQPIGHDTAFRLTIQTKGRLTEVGEFEKAVIGANPDGSFVRIKDMGRIEVGAK